MKSLISKYCIFFIVFFTQQIFSQELIPNVKNQTTTLLNGQWNYIIDPYETGYYSFHHDAYDQQRSFQKAAFFNNYHAQNKQELVEFDFDKSPSMTIPGDWNSQDPMLVYFGAVNYKAEVYLNGVKLGIHEGGFTPFNFEISSIIKAKDNFLVVKVDNVRHKEAVPTLNTDWFNYGGITRDVILIEEPKSFVQDYMIQIKKGYKNTISGFVKINNFDKTGEFVRIKIPELGIKYKGKIDANGSVNF
jgi:beta-glucuronidase